jgi:DNA polymerase III delta prime subunit
MSNIPWIEFYRPKIFDEIVLDDLNKKILTNIINNNRFPNLLFYGPPGTGKTTTIINLINAYQQKINCVNQELIIHLNASDERGIDIIRNQISQFVNAKSLFKEGMKFIILDEVDYMTKNAQQALRYLLQSNNIINVRFCLICNYISKIDECLQTEFVKLRFNQLPIKNIISFLKNIVEKEKLNVDDSTLLNIQRFYKSDIRSMINYIQSNQELFKFPISSNMNSICIKDNNWEALLNMMRSNPSTKNVCDELDTISRHYNIDKRNLMKEFLNYIIRNNQTTLKAEFFYFVENLMHTTNNEEVFLKYGISKLIRFVQPSNMHNTV